MALQHLRSSTANKRPTPGSMSDGQLALNTNVASPGAFFKDSTGALVKAGPVHVGTTAPNASPAVGGQSGNSIGEQWLDTSASPAQLKVWNGTAWVSALPDELPVSKLADGSARQLLQTDAAGTGVEWTSNVDVPGTLDVTGATTLDSTLTVPAGSAASPSISFTSDPDTGLYSPGANQVALSTNGTGRLFVDASGNVGVGGSPNAWSFPIAQVGRASFFGVGDNAYIGGNLYFDGSNYKYIDDGYATRTSFNTTGGLVFSSSASGTAGGVVTLSEKFRITSAGLVGVGTSSPNFSTFGSNSGGVHVKDVGSNNSGIKIEQGTNKLHLMSSATKNFIFSDANTPLGIATNGTERLSITAAGLVGIGTSSPGSYYEQADNLVIGSTGNNGITIVSGTGGIGRVHFADGDATSNAAYRGYIIYDHSSDALSLGAAADTALHINSSRNVGIGTTSPVRPLSVSNGGAEGFEFGPGDTAGTNLTLHYNRSTSAYIGSINQANYHTWSAGGASEKMRIDSAGRLLVGTSTSRSVVIGNSAGWQARNQIASTSTSNIGLSLFSWSTYSADVGGGAGVGPDIVLARSNSNSEGTQAAVTNGMLLGRINFNGSDGTAFANGAYISAASDGQTWASGDCPARLVFSVTRDGQASPTEALRIENNGRSMFKAATAVTYIETATTAGTTHALITGAYSSGTVSLRVWTNGNIQNTNNSYTGISDIKLKENIVDANSQWDDIKALRPVNYNFKEGQTHTQLGLIAQEVELVSPGLVSESPDRDEDGNDLGTVTKSVNYSVLYMKAVKALQEAMERIETLEAKVAALESA